MLSTNRSYQLFSNPVSHWPVALRAESKKKKHISDELLEILVSSRIFEEKPPTQKLVVS